jgi:hypothetical protein
MDPQGLARIERINYVLTAIAIAVGAVVLGRPYALGLGVGALVGSVNFSLIRRLVDRWMQSAESRRGAVALLFVPKMMALMAVVVLLLYLLPMSPVFFTIGFSLFLVSIAVETVRFTLGGKSSAASHPRKP